MIRCYSDDEERRVRMQRQLRDWARVGLISGAQATQFSARVAVGLKRTNMWLRVVLSFFTVFVVGSVTGLVGFTLGVRQEGWAVVQACIGVACLFSADHLARSLRLYRYGIEEMLAVSAAGLFALSTLVWLTIPPNSVSLHASWLAALVVAATGGLCVYLRFGLIYAAAGAAICAGLVPFETGLTGVGPSLASAAVFAVTFAGVHALRLRHGEEFPGDDYALMQLAPLAGLYLALNVHDADIIGGTPASLPAWFYWSTYAATWLIPIAALATAIRRKDRPLLTLGFVLLIGTLATNKPYLHITRETWDPMILGVLLMGAALGLRRWLSAGAAGQRDGYTATPMLQSDRELLGAVADASVLWHAGATHAPSADPTAPTFQGGRSGGGGGGAEY